jgi:hypothetical protein
MPRRLITFCLILLLASAALAQDTPSSLPIDYGQRVSGSISDDAFFDHWQLNASAHDRIYARMTGADGLRPLIGILSAGGSLLARSADGAPNDTVDLSFDAPETGLYILVATRVENERGTSTGSYTLSVENTNPQPTRNPQYQDVTFACGTGEATAAASIHFSRDDTDNGAYSIRVYGLDGFQPVIRVQSGSTDVCAAEPADALGDVITLPGEPSITLAQADLAHTTQYVINAANTPDPASITVTVGSLNGQTGRYLAVIGGFAIEPIGDFDTLEARLAPRPAQGSAPLLLYVIGDGRLDPSVIAPDGRCDDAGRRGCESMPLAAGAGVVFNNGARVIGDRFDAGARLTDAAPNQLQIISFGGTTHGAYTLLLIGALPAANS